MSATLNPIPRSSFFVTPDSLVDLQERIQAMTNEQERAIAFQISMMTFNLAHKLVEENKQEI